MGKKSLKTSIKSRVKEDDDDNDDDNSLKNDSETVEFLSDKKISVREKGLKILIQKLR